MQRAYPTASITIRLESTLGAGKDAKDETNLPSPPSDIDSTNHLSRSCITVLPSPGHIVQLLLKIINNNRILKRANQG